DSFEGCAIEPQPGERDRPSGQPLGFFDYQRTGEGVLAALGDRLPVSELIGPIEVIRQRDGTECGHQCVLILMAASSCSRRSASLSSNSPVTVSPLGSWKATLPSGRLGVVAAAELLLACSGWLACWRRCASCSWLRTRAVSSRTCSRRRSARWASAAAAL